MMGMHYRIKAYGELQIIAAVMQRLDQRTMAPRTIAVLYWTDADTEEG